MAFNPSSTIWLCNVPFDSTYKNQIYFANATEQQTYFSKQVATTLTDYLTVRKTLPDGSLQSSLKVNMNIDQLHTLHVNYMYYRNANHGTKLFYAFVTKLIYINEGTTEIVFETDVYQTWRFETTLLSSYVIREHSTTDVKGDNVVPEKFNFQDYVYTRINKSNLEQWGYLVATTEQRGSDGSRGKMMSGIYQGLYFYYYHNENNLNDFLDEIEEEGGDCVVFIAVIPKFCVTKNTIGATETDKTNGEGWLYYSSEPAKEFVDIDMSGLSFSHEGYNPKNNKLFTSPFMKLIVTNHNGEQAEYIMEDFKDHYARFTMYGDVSANPSVTLVPNNYKGVSEYYDAGISISGFPQCSFNSDTFKLWLAKNQYGVALETVGNVGQIIAGVVATVGTSGAGAVIGGSQIVAGATGILNTINGVYQASKEPNKSHNGSAKNNLLTAIKKNNFEFYVQSLKSDYAKTIDDYFTMFGYQTNRVKVPNVSARPYFNYVQTADVNIRGGIPADDMLRLKQMYNSGVTLWKPNATIGNYNVDNSP